MAVDKERINSLLNQLPEHLQQEVLAFAESLVGRAARESTNGMPQLKTLFGIWDSGDAHSADNDRIDSDLARECASPHEAKQ
jgi:hypothetical protein